MTTTEKIVFTPEDFLALPDSVAYELVDGNLVERHMGAESSAIAAAIIRILGTFVNARRLGHVLGSDCSYQCFPGDPDKLRRADVSFIAMGRLADERVPRRQIRISPDLAVEVLSPGDLADEVEEKVKEYLDAGVRLIWIISPLTHSVRIHRPKAASAGPIGELAE